MLQIPIHPLKVASLSFALYPLLGSFAWGAGNASSATLSAVSLSFGGEGVGKTSASQQVSLTNTGNQALSISGIAVTGAGASSFVFANSCGPTLGVGAHCTIHGHFTPTAMGALAADLVISDNAANSPQSISVTGMGLQPLVSLSATSLCFGTEDVGATSTSQQVTLTNTGNQALSISGIAVTGAGALSFVFANSCGSTLGIGAHCTIHGHFTPTAGGALAGAVVISDNAADSPQSIALTGAGQVVIPNPLPTLASISPASVLAGSGDTAIVVSGAGFIGSSVVRLNGQPLATTFVSPSSLQAFIPSAQLKAKAADTVKVTSPAPGGGTSSAAPFSVTRAAVETSVVVYAATPAGIIASIEAARLGKKVILFEPSRHVGGMTSSGLGQTDSYDLRALGGLVSKFFQTVHSIDVAAGNPGDANGLHYEPHVAEAAFQQMLAEYPDIDVVYGVSLANVVRSGSTIQGVTMSDGVTLYVAFRGVRMISRFGGEAVRPLGQRELSLSR